MATTVISTLTNSIVTLNVSDDYILAEGVTHYASSIVLDINGDFADATILGTLISTDSDAIDGAAFSDLHVLVADTGSVLSSDLFRPLDFGGTDNRLTNNGLVAGSRTELDGDNSVVVNNGTLTGTTGHLSSVSALQMLGANAQVLNNGLLSSNTANVIEFGNTASLVNTGTISGMGTTIKADTLTPLEVLTVDNSGDIAAGVTAIESGDGADVVRNSGSITGNVNLGSGADQLVTLGDGYVFGQVDGGAGLDTLTGGSAEDDFLGGSDNDRLEGREGNDTLDGGSGGDELFGGVGDDQLIGGDGAGWDQAWGGWGDDHFAGGDGNDSAWMGSGADTAMAGAGDDAVMGGLGDDSIDMGGGADLARGMDGDDTILAGSAGSDTLRGGAGNDSIDASGGFGWDWIGGGHGSDTLTGGSGNDDFVFYRNPGHDVITDFENNVDDIDLTAFGIADFAALNGSGAISGDATITVIDLGAAGYEGSITLLGFNVAQMSAQDFLF